MEWGSMEICVDELKDLTKRSRHFSGDHYEMGRT